MSASASGPIGALLLIAPLAAIPVFAIVGLPQFAPLAASPAEDDVDSEVALLGTASRSSTAPPAPRKADDLFAPIGSATDNGSAGATRDSSSTDTKSPGSSISDRYPGGRTSNPNWTPPPGALDGWELGSSGHFAEPTADRDTRGIDNAARHADRSSTNTPDSSAIEAGFDPGLLQTERPRQRSSAGEKPTAPGRNRETAELRGSRGTEEKQLATSGPAADMAAFYGKQGWLAAAARLRELGIRNYQLEWVVEDQRFVFWCTVPSGRDTRVSNRFEAQDEEPLFAVQKTLADVEASFARAGR